MTLLKVGEKFDVIVNTVTSTHCYASSKLYTTDFFALIRSRLAKGSIYSGWFDLTIGLEGIDYMLNTLESSFAERRNIFLPIGYFNAACGAEPLERHSKEQLEERPRSLASVPTDPLNAKYSCSH